MCFFRDIYTYCMCCGVLTAIAPRRREECNASTRNGRTDHSCPYFEHHLTLILLPPTGTQVRCYWCYTGQIPPADIVAEGADLLLVHFYRCGLTQMGALQRGSYRAKDDIYGPAQASITTMPW